MKAGFLLLVCVEIVFCLIGICEGNFLKKNFYKETCPCAEDIIRSQIWKHVSLNPNLPAKVPRMQFHDCFVRGSDASILINSTANSTADKDTFPNLVLSGFDVIEDIKAELEKECPGVVSCADIVASASRDSVSFQFDNPMWEVLTGRRDGRVSLASEFLDNIPSPFANFTQLKQNFNSRGLSVQDLVVLSVFRYAHDRDREVQTVQQQALQFHGERIWSRPFTGPNLCCFLEDQMPEPCDNTTKVKMDPGSSRDFDTHYYVLLNQNKGLLQTDAALLTNKGARNIVLKLMGNQTRFFTEFAKSMQRLGAIGVLTDQRGEIGKICSAVINPW